MGIFLRDSEEYAYFSLKIYDTRRLGGKESSERFFPQKIKALCHGK